MAKFTERQMEDAKATNLEDYLRHQGERLVRSGGEYRWVYRDGAGEHDSVTIRGNRWYDHKRDMGGDSIGFLQEFEGLSFREAVVSLLSHSLNRPLSCAYFSSPPQRSMGEAARFPPRNANHHRLYAYLCKSRGIPHEIVTHFVRAGILYEDAKFHNVVFLATDEQGKPCGGMKKSTLSNSSFRQTIEGSDTRYAFHHKGDSGKLFVFEAAVDLLSFISLHPEDWQHHSYLALDGVSSKSLHHFLNVHADISRVCLCLDNDEAGQKATNRIAAELQERWNGQVLTFASTEKDWNEELKSRQQICCRDEPELSL